MPFIDARRELAPLVERARAVAGATAVRARAGKLRKNWPEKRTSSHFSARTAAMSNAGNVEMSGFGNVKVAALRQCESSAALRASALAAALADQVRKLKVKERKEKRKAERNIADTQLLDIAVDVWLCAKCGLFLAAWRIVVGAQLAREGAAANAR